MSTSATATFDGDLSPIFQALDELMRRLDSAGQKMEQSFYRGNDAAEAAARSAASVGEGAGGVQVMKGALDQAGSAAMQVGRFIGAIGNAVMLASPLVQMIPKELHAAVAPAQKLVAQTALLHGGLEAVHGRLGLVGAAVGFINARAAGASKGLAFVGSAGAYALSGVVRTGRAAVGVLGTVASAAMAAGGALTAAFAPVLAAGSILLLPLAAATAMVGLGQKSIAAAAEVQTLEASFVTLLGSVDKAQERVKYLADFAAETPFDLPGLARASKVLETLTKGALSTGDGLRMVGDIAANVDPSQFQEVAMHVGRIYDGLMNGRAVGESLQRMMELGAIKSSPRAQIEAMQKAGKKGEEVWQVARQELSKFDGDMLRKSFTWRGLLANIGERVSSSLAAFGRPLITALSPFLVDLLEVLRTLPEKAARFGQAVANAITITRQLFEDGKIGDVVGKALIIGWAKFVNFAIGSIGALFGAIANGLYSAITGAFTAALNLVKGEGLSKVGESLTQAVGSATEAISRLMKGEGLIDTSALEADLSAVFGNALNRGKSSLLTQKDPIRAAQEDDRAASMKRGDPSALRKIGGGYYRSQMEQRGDPVLREAQRSRALLEQIAANTGRAPSKSSDLPRPRYRHA